QIPEGDSASVKVGTRAEIVVPALPGRSFVGRVTYIDPRVDMQARTVQVRIELNNPGMALKLGMFVDVYLEGRGGGKGAATAEQFVSVPGNAVQVIGARQVVFIATAQTGVLVQREVRAGNETDGTVPVYEGLGGGERVITEGSFLLRAESVRQRPEQLKGK